MIQANELRIGNIVSYLGKETEITGTSIGYVSTLSSGSLSQNQIEPIPLTEEWLLNMGFTKEFRGCFSIGTGFVIYVNVHNNVAGLRLNDFYAGTGGIIKSAVHLKNVHQLQNLYFALTGEELKIINK